MYIRCSICHASLWIQSLGARGSSTAACEGCGQAYDVRGVTRLGSTRAEQHRNALEFARRKNIDLPGSYSVLLGIMSLEDALELANGGASPRKPARAAPAPVPAMTVTYDEEFQDAVEQGYLTPGQAMERGSRAKYAERLVARHRLPDELAYAVADNRVSLLGALRQRPPEKPIAATPRVTHSPPRRFRSGSTFLAAAALATLAVGALALYSWEKSTRVAAPPDAARRPADHSGDRRLLGEADAAQAATEMLTNERGQTVRVAGREPDAVLVAFCDLGEMAGRLQPLQIAETIPPAPLSRLGIVMDREAPETLFAITIRQDRGSGRWIAGDGSEPIRVVPVPEPILAALRAGTASR